jgi:uncharacterized protein YjiS (DUF1127 family)
MTALRLRGSMIPDPNKDLIAEAIQRAGPLRVLAAALRALLRPRARPPDIKELSPHLLKDLGLDPSSPPVPPSARLSAGSVPLCAQSFVTLPGTGLR